MPDCWCSLWTQFRFASELSYDDDSERGRNVRIRGKMVPFAAALPLCREPPLVSSARSLALAWSLEYSCRAHDTSDIMYDDVHGVQYAPAVTHLYSGKAFVVQCKLCML